MRDYGTGQWEGGDPDCDHAVRTDARVESSTLGGGKSTTGHQREGFKDVCPRCGATRKDSQLGLEETPDAYVAEMVGVFRGVWRVLADHGTVWVNLGDSYFGAAGGYDPKYEPDDDDPKSFGGTKNAQVRVNQRQKRAAPPPHPDLKTKDLCGIPWRVAFALQADGWYLRADIIWAKPNPMPESVSDRPTKAHEYVFFLSKRPRYFFDQDAVREPNNWPIARWGSNGKYEGEPGKATALASAELNPAGRNIRTVWEIATQPYPEAHFATYPEELVRRCLLAGCPVRVCRVCGKPSERLTERIGGPSTRAERTEAANGNVARGVDFRSPSGGRAEFQYSTAIEGSRGVSYNTTGWSDCGHNQWRPGLVLDPFMGSGTTALVARKHGRHAVGVELSPTYAELCARRLSQLSLLAEA